MKKKNLSRVLLLPMVLILACGGAEKPQKGSFEDCRARLSDILSREKVCNEILSEDLETEVKDWRAICSRFADKEEKTRLEDKVASSRKCTDDLRMEEARHKQCAEMVYRAAGTADCWGSDCRANLDGIHKILSECGAFGMDAASLELARSLIAEFERKIEEENSYGAMLDELSETAARARGLLEKDDAAGALKLLTDQLDKSTELGNPVPEGATVAKKVEEVLPQFGSVLSSSIKSRTALAFSELGDMEIQKRPAEWMSRYREIEEAYNRLNLLRAESLFPGTVKVLGEPLEKFSDLHKKLAAAEKWRMVEKGKKALTRGVLTCKQHKKKMAMYEEKIAYYEKQEDKGKMDAYRSQLTKSEEALARLAENIQLGVELKVLPERRTKQLLKQIEKAGCGAKTETAVVKPSTADESPTAEETAEPQEPQSAQ